jgi:hypothetical protein
MEAAPINPSTLRSRARRARMTPAERTAYAAKYAHKRRLDLLRELAPDGKCAKCGEVFDHEQLEVNHVNGITWDHESLNQHRRYARYWKEYRAGVLMNAHCQPCNGSDGKKFRWGFDKAGRRRAA